MLRFLLLATPGLLLLAGVLLLDKPEVETEIAVQIESENAEQQIELSRTSVPEVAIAPDLNKKGNGFELMAGIKDILDSLIFSSGSTDKLEIVTFSRDYCEQQQLSAAGCASFLDLLARYIDYKLTLKQVEAQKLNISDHIAAIEYQFDAIKKAQESYFNQAESEALFAEDWIMDQQALARKAIAVNKTMSKEERTQLIAQQLDNLPESEKSALQPTLTMTRLEELKSSHADKRMVLLDVETELGSDAAQRLEKTWQKQEDFQRRIDLVANEYLAIGASGSDEQERMALQEQLLTEHFKGNELRRAKAILRHHKSNS